MGVVTEALAAMVAILVMLVLLAATGALVMLILSTCITHPWVPLDLHKLALVRMLD
jgi:hypothetical protein